MKTLKAGATDHYSLLILSRSILVIFTLFMREPEPYRLTSSSLCVTAHDLKNVLPFATTSDFIYASHYFVVNKLHNANKRFFTLIYTQRHLKCVIPVL